VHVWQWTRERTGKCLALLICAALLPMAMALATPEQSFAVEPRMALQRYWAIFRAWQFSIALGCFFSVTACNVYGLPWEPKVVAWVFEGFVTLLLAAAATPQNRDRLHTALSHLTVRSEADAAAGIAALLGNVDPKVALANAQSSFAGIPLSKLKKEHFSSSQDSSLTAYAVRCRLGAVDAFLSHSWRDSPDHKWAALMEWAEDFACTSTRDPLLWLDKVRDSRTRPLTPFDHHTCSLLARHASTKTTYRNSWRACPFTYRVAARCWWWPALRTPSVSGASSKSSPFSEWAAVWSVWHSCR